MKLKYHALFKTQLDSFPADVGVGLVWYIVIEHGNRHIHRLAVNVRNPTNDINCFLKPNKYKFVEIMNQMPVFEKL